MATHRIVIIGIGAVAHAIAQAVGKLPNATVVAGSCRTREKGEKFAATYNCRWYEQTEEMLAEERPDVAVVTTPSGAHLEAVLACCKHGVNVLSEKPLEITTGRIQQMREAAEKAGVRLGGIFPQRFNPAIQVLQRAAAGGRFGNLSLVAATVPWWREDAYYGGGRWQGTVAMDGGGAMMNQAIHSIDVLQWLASSTMKDLPGELNPVEEVFAFTGKRGHDPKLIEVEDTAVAVLRFRNGALGQILAATSCYPGTLRRMLIAGRDGTAELMEDQLTRYQFRKEMPEDEATRKVYGGATSHSGGVADPMAFEYSKHQRNIAAYLEALERGVEPELNAVESGKAVAIIEACYESARTGRAVRI